MFTESADIVNHDLVATGGCRVLHGSQSTPSVCAVVYLTIPTPCCSVFAIAIMLHIEQWLTKS